VDPIDHDHEKDVEASSGHEDMIIMAKLTAVNILHPPSIDDVLRQSDGVLNHPNLRPDINATARLLRHVGHLVLSRRFEDRLGEGVR